MWKCMYKIISHSPFCVIKILNQRYRSLRLLFLNRNGKISIIFYEHHNCTKVMKKYTDRNPLNFKIIQANRWLQISVVLVSSRNWKTTYTYDTVEHKSIFVGSKHENPMDQKIYSGTKLVLNRIYTNIRYNLYVSRIIIEKSSLRHTNPVFDSYIAVKIKWCFTFFFSSLFLRTIYSPSRLWYSFESKWNSVKLRIQGLPINGVILLYEISERILVTRTQKNKNVKIFQSHTHELRVFFATTIGFRSIT